MSSSVTPKNDPAIKQSPGIFSGLGNPDANKPMFEQLALLTPAIVPKDPQSVIRPEDSAAKLLDHSALVMERKLEMMNVFLVYCPFTITTLNEGFRTMQSIYHHESRG